MSEPFVVLIDRLRGGRSWKIEGAFDARFLGPDEPDLRFSSKVQLKGEAYLTDSHLIVHLKASTTVEIPCSICNQMTPSELKVDNFYHTEPIENIPSAQFDFSEQLREALLIELPKTVECNQGKCPERQIITPYMRTEKKQERTYLPFANLDDL